MLNLIRDSVSLAQLQDIFAANPPTPLLPPLGDARWRACAESPVTRSLLAAIEPLARADADAEFPALSDELYREFGRSGNRIKFESVYFERRRRLARAVFCALFAADAAAWLPVVRRYWQEIFDEQSWALPAHVADPSGRDPYRIDLFANETANLMGELLNVFGAEVDDAWRARIEARLRDQVFNNYLDHPERHSWTSTTNNWNAVCHQGVLGAALALEADSDLLARLCAAAAAGLAIFLSGFSDDGGCSEGPGYWGYGFGWFAVLNEQLETRTRGALSLFEGDPLVRRIATYGRRTLLSEHWVAAFADCDPHALPRASLLAYLGRRLDDAANSAQAASLYSALAHGQTELNELRADTFFLLRTALFAPLSYSAAASAAPLRENAQFPDLGMWISHGLGASGLRWAVAAKAGHNDEHHNHNDCGSFMVVVDDQSLIDEIGAPEYVRDFFGPRRYSFFAARSLGHSLPLINGCEQGTGRGFEAVVEEARQGDLEDFFKFDLTACYPAAAHCRRYVRSLRIDRRVFALELSDDFAAPAEVPIESALITRGAVETIDGTLTISSNGRSLCIEVLEGSFVRTETHSYSDHRGEPTAVSRLVFAPRRADDRALLRLRLAV